MRPRDYRVRQNDLWQFSSHENALDAAYPSMRQRTTAAVAGIACALAWYAWAVPPSKPIKPGNPSDHVSLTRIVPNALRALTGLTASRPSDSAQRAGTFPGAGIRN